MIYKKANMMEFIRIPLFTHPLGFIYLFKHKSSILTICHTVNIHVHISIRHFRNAVDISDHTIRV